MSFPEPVVSDQFGVLGGPATVELIVLDTLKTWLWPTYLQEAERQAGLVPDTIPKPESFIGSPDLEEWEQDDMPCVIAVCEVPESEPERLASVGHVQAYRVTVAAIVKHLDEDPARLIAGRYAAALEGVMNQQFAGEHLDIVDDIRMIAAPSISLQDTDVRLIYTGQCSFDIYISIIDDALGPVLPLQQGQKPPESPEVTETNVTIDAEPL